jgi:predicted ATP-dependent endonuclease of OLD family
MEQDVFPPSIQFEEDAHNIVSRDKLEMMLSFRRVIYIDTPMALSCDSSSNYFWYQLKSMLMRKTDYDFSIPKKKLLETYIRAIIGGKVNVQKGRFNDDELHYVRESDGLNIDIKNAATGLKSFAYILRLLENGYLDDKTLLIIDEPEAHLHPQWVVEFARVLVRLQSILGVKVLINSHNPDMVAAVQSIAAKEKVIGSTTFYLAEKHKNTAQYDYRNLGHEIDEIFTSFNIAISRMQEYGADVD